jgi:hypothetical protein
MPVPGLLAVFSSQNEDIGSGEISAKGLVFRKKIKSQIFSNG